MSGCKSTLIGNLPCNSGNRLETLVVWNAPDAINSIWSVCIGPYLVVIVVPSTNGNKSRWTPSALASADLSFSPDTTLSISSITTIPFSSTALIASEIADLSLTNWEKSESNIYGLASFTGNVLVTVRFWLIAFPSISPSKIPLPASNETLVNEG